MKKILVGLVSAVALATFATGMAAASKNSMVADQSSNDSAGVFISGNLGYGSVDQEKSDYAPVQPNSIDNSGVAWNINLGYQFNKNIAIEGGYTQFADTVAKFDNINGTGINGTNKTSLSGFGADAKLIFPVSDQFDLFAKGGAIDLHESQLAKVAGVSEKVTGSAWTPELGVGAAYNLTKNVSLSLQDIYTLKTHFTKTVNNVSTRVNIPSTNAVLVGASYKFNI